MASKYTLRFTYLQTSVLRRCQSAQNNLVSAIRVNPCLSVARLFVGGCLVAAATYLRLLLRPRYACPLYRAKQFAKTHALTPFLFVALAYAPVNFNLLEIVTPHDSLFGQN
jgi:hypothetical protein